MPHKYQTPSLVAIKWYRKRAPPKENSETKAKGIDKKKEKKNVYHVIAIDNPIRPNVSDGAEDPRPSVGLPRGRSAPPRPCPVAPGSQPACRQ